MFSISHFCHWKILPTKYLIDTIKIDTLYILSIHTKYSTKNVEPFRQQATFLVYSHFKAEYKYHRVAAVTIKLRNCLS